MPTPTNKAPQARLSQVVMAEPLRTRSPMRAQNQINGVMTTMLLTIKMRPRITKAHARWVESGPMNCGRNARKKSATLGFNVW